MPHHHAESRILSARLCFTRLVAPALGIIWAVCCLPCFAEHRHLARQTIGAEHLPGWDAGRRDLGCSPGGSAYLFRTSMVLPLLPLPALSLAAPAFQPLVGVSHNVNRYAAARRCAVLTTTNLRWFHSAWRIFKSAKRAVAPGAPSVLRAGGTCSGDNKLPPRYALSAPVSRCCY